MPTRLAIAASALAMLLSGCSATLRDATYGCAAGGVCPSGFFCWSADLLCHTRPEGDSGPGSPDTGMMMIDAGGMGPMCTPPCTGGAMCVIGQWSAPPSMPSLACGSTPAPPRHGSACTMGPASGCVAPDACLPGPASNPACMRPCDPHTATCGFGEDCIMVGSPLCARPCAGTACPTPMVCNAASGHCLPPGW